MKAKLWPDPRQEALLRAALADGAEARESFETWAGEVDIEQDIDGGSYRLLPLLYSNLKRLGHEHPLMPKLAGVYRRSWCEAQIRQQQLAAPLDLLARANIPIMLSKGIVHGLAYYSSPGMRPMSDVDVVVPPERALEALELLKGRGWSMMPGGKQHWGARPRDMMILAAGAGLVHPDGGELDLQWRLVHESLHRRAETEFWNDAVPITIGGQRVLRPSVTDLLFHVIIHGMRPNELSPIRWIADAAMILRKEGDSIDWDRMFRTADTMQVRFRLGRALAYLDDVMHLALPAKVVAAARVRPSLLERLEARADAALVDGTAADRKTDFPFLAFLARFLASDRRAALPGLVVSWLIHKRRQARQVTASS